MAGRALRVTSRIAFLVCGLTSLLTAFLYVAQEGEDLPVQREWAVFAVALGLVGLVSLLGGLVPRSWAAKACHTDRDDEQLFSKALRLLAVLAGVGYFVAVFAYLAPHSWNLNPQLMFAVCPMYFVKMIVDPSPVWIFLVLAPMNAAVYGALGVTLGYALLAYRARHAR